MPDLKSYRPTKTVGATGFVAQLIHPLSDRLAIEDATDKAAEKAATEVAENVAARVIKEVVEKQAETVDKSEQTLFVK